MAQKVWTGAFYEVDRHYGGPEEGGWWYDSGQFVRVSRTFRSEEQATAWAWRANSLLNTIQRNGRDVGSVLYSGGRYEADIFDGLPPAFYPTEMPHYE